MKSFTRISSSQHATAEVRPASPTRHTHHDAPSDGSGTTYCSTEPCILCPVLHLQPAAVHQSATGPADDTLPVTGKIWLSSTPLSEQLAPPRRLLPQEPHATITVKTLVPSLSAGSLYPSQLFAVSHLSDRCLWSSSLTGCQQGASFSSLLICAADCRFLPRTPEGLLPVCMQACAWFFFTKSFLFNNPPTFFNKML